MKKVNIGIMAHVDAGKTTLSESMLYRAGVLRQKGRVDDGNSFMDSNDTEKRRGITIYSAQTDLVYGDTEITLVDTPGHVDFSGETERVMPVLDYAVLLISGIDGVQSHTRTLFRLLDRYDIPTFIFVNKMDISRRTEEDLLDDIKRLITPDALDFRSEDLHEDIATLDEALTERYLSDGSLSDTDISSAIAARKIFPVFFGSALKDMGIDPLLDALDRYTIPQSYTEDFGAIVYKIARDAAGKRCTYMKITGGTLHARDSILPYGAYPDEACKVNEIRSISGDKWKPLSEVKAGGLCAVTGVDNSYPGRGYGNREDTDTPELVPVLSYKVVTGEGEDIHKVLSSLQELMDEEPLLCVKWDDRLGEISVSLMGRVQLEILKEKMKNRFDIDIDFGAGNIIYKETIAAPTIGHGHYEPLKHFADVVLTMEPLAPGSGIEVDTDLRTEDLPKNYQHQILNRLSRRPLYGVLTCSALTDIKITLSGGKHHKKHTEGGDFRRATEIAVRDGLLRTENLLLEPFYKVTLELPSENVGRAMTDIEKMKGSIGTPEISGDMCILEGTVPVVNAMNYSEEVRSYTGGLGSVRFEMAGYYPCHDADGIIEKTAYDYRSDIKHPYESIYVHGENPDEPLPGDSADTEKLSENVVSTPVRGKKTFSGSLSEDEELMEIFHRTFGDTERNIPRRREITADKQANIKAAREEYLLSHPRGGRGKKKPEKRDYLLVDGYNVIFAWDDLKELSMEDLKSARDALLDIVSNYCGYTGEETIVVFDAYKVKGQKREEEKYSNLTVVYTKEGETADAYIERKTHELAAEKGAEVRVVSSDGLIQTIILGEGARRISAREFKELVSRPGA